MRLELISEPASPLLVEPLAFRSFEVLYLQSAYQRLCQAKFSLCIRAILVSKVSHLFFTELMPHLD